MILKRRKSNKLVSQHLLQLQHQYQHLWFQKYQRNLRKLTVIIFILLKIAFVPDHTINKEVITASVDDGNKKKSPKPAGTMFEANITIGSEQMQRIFHNV